MAFTPRTETYVNLASLSDPFNITVTKPEGTADGDILFCWIGWRHVDIPTIDSVPSGWTLLGEYVEYADSYALYYKIAASEGASWVWSLTSDAQVRAVCSCYTSGDFDGADPIDVVSNTAYRTWNTTCRAASMAVSAVSSPLVFWGGIYSATAKTFTKPSVPTTDWVEDDDAGSDVPDFWTEVCSFIWSGSGATGDIDATLSGSSSSKHAFAVALNPAAAGGDVTIDAPCVSVDSEGQIPSMALDRIFGAPLVAVDSASQVPVMSLGVSLASPLVDVESSVIVPSLILDRIFSAPLVSIDSEVFVPTIIVPGGVTIDVPLVVIDGQPLIPSLALDRIFSAPVISVDSAVPIPVLSLGLTLLPPLISIDSEVFVPVIISPDVIIAVPLTAITSLALVPIITVEGAWQLTQTLLSAQQAKSMYPVLIITLTHDEDEYVYRT